MKNDKFLKKFHRLEELDDSIHRDMKDYNLLLLKLRKNPPVDVSLQEWQELECLDYYPVNDYEK